MHFLSSPFLPVPFHPTWFHHPNNISWLKMLMYVIVPFSAPSCHFIPLTSKYPPQTPSVSLLSLRWMTLLHHIQMATVSLSLWWTTVYGFLVFLTARLLNRTFTFSLVLCAASSRDGRLCTVALILNIVLLSYLGWKVWRKDHSE
jgi:hypothetical protein